MDSNSKVVSTPLLKPVKDRDFLTHLESYLAKCNSVDKLLKISRYTAKITLSSSPKPPISTPTSNPSNPASASPARPSALANSSRISTPSAPTTPSRSLHTAVKASTISSNNWCGSPKLAPSTTGTCHLCRRSAPGPSSLAMLGALGCRLGI
ncbi:peroxisomal membrane protein 11A [Cinnamomum micranthum f. kanehirae]|uniref:Peroxisomal membrane protein 11A n=1 Tax=Cinnamomum micranthum f. kanehirae TaxID=337451 RepID=A0A3S3NWI0_9MAGN|nr:peroxisomal membrane protein 11A [Cinnamomum micranthum f. kanehirae]